MNASVKRARLGVERLEAREVMDASISVSGGALLIDGTRHADGFLVREIDVGAPAYQVNALLHEGRQGTFNDGKTSDVFRANRISASLGQGNDLLILQGLSTRGSVTVSTGSGDDTVRLLGAAVGGRVVLDLGSGDDVAASASSSARTSMEVKGRAGQDYYTDFGGNAYGSLGLTLSSLIATHRESVNGQVTSVVGPTAENPLGTMEGVGTGDATHLGHYNETFIHNFTAPDAQGVGLVLNGRFSSTAADGSTISGIYFGTYRFVSESAVEYRVTAIYQTGTGRFAGVTGSGDVVAQLNAVTGIFHFDTVGSWTFP